jgi:signal transduction histidine kinase
MKSVFSGLVLILVFRLLAQPVDSLEKVLQSKSLTPADSLLTLNLLSRNLTYIQPNKSLQYARRAFELAQQLNNTAGLADAYRNLANVYSYNENFALALEYIQRAMDLFTQLHDSTGLGNCYITLGHTYRRLQHRQKEVYYHRKAYHMFRQLHNPERLGVSAHNLGESYYNVGLLDRARLLTLQAIRLNTAVGNRPVLSSCYKVMGLVALAQQQYDSAEAYCNKALALSESLGEYAQKEAAASAMLTLAKVYQATGRPQQAAKTFQSTLAYCQRHKLYQSLREVYYQLAMGAANENNTAAAAVFFEQYRQVADSMRKQWLDQEIYLLEAAASLHELNKAHQQLELTSQHQKKQMRLLYSLLAVIAALKLLMFIFIKRILKLRQDVTERMQVIEQQKQQLEQLNATKDKFFSIVAHDLRSPLNSLAGMLKLVKDHAQVLSKEEILKMIYQLEDKLNNTLGLAENLLMWARLQMGNNHRQPEKIKLKELVANTCQLYQQVALTKGLQIKCEIDNDVTVHADKYQLAFVIRNLVNNAVKFTPAGGQIRVAAKKMDEKKVQVCVADTGVGIPPQRLTGIFREGLMNTTPGTAGEKGTGLGLMLSYEFLRQNNGTIEVKSQPDQGTEFIIELPA